jgi:hypothetical protein
MKGAGATARPSSLREPLAAEASTFSWSWGSRGRPWVASCSDPWWPGRRGRSIRGRGSGAGPRHPDGPRGLAPPRRHPGRLRRPAGPDLLAARDGLAVALVQGDHLLTSVPGGGLHRVPLLRPVLHPGRRADRGRREGPGPGRGRWLTEAEYREIVPESPASSSGVPPRSAHLRGDRRRRRRDEALGVRIGASTRWWTIFSTSVLRRSWESLPSST